jgi:hypothetical protein
LSNLRPGMGNALGDTNASRLLSTAEWLVKPLPTTKR